MIQEIDKNDWDTKQKLDNTFPKLSKLFFEQNKRSNIFRKAYIMSEEKQTVGYMIIDTIYERMELIEIEVLEEKRRKGYGNKLMEFMIKKAKAENIENITLEVKENNKSAIGLYEKNGFKKVAIRKKYYQNIDGILMERKMM